MLECESFSQPMDEFCRSIRSRVAAVTKPRALKAPRRQINASFSEAEFRLMQSMAERCGLTGSTFLREVALAAIGRGRSEEEKELAQLNASLRETLDLLRKLYRDSDGWQRWQVSELRPVLRRFLALEERVRGLLTDFDRRDAR